MENLTAKIGVCQRARSRTVLGRSTLQRRRQVFNPYPGVSPRLALFHAVPSMAFRLEPPSWLRARHG